MTLYQSYYNRVFAKNIERGRYTLDKRLFYILFKLKAFFLKKVIYFLNQKQNLDVPLCHLEIHQIDRFFPITIKL